MTGRLPISDDPSGAPRRRQGLIDREVIAWNLGVGIPATALGALATRWVGGPFLVRI